MFSPNSVHVIPNKLTDQVPLFVREGAIVATQDVQKVRSTKDLDNSYLLSAAFHYDTRRSNTTHQYYEAIGAVLSIKDLSDNSLVDLCVRAGCDYVINAIATITPITRSIELDINYFGENHLNQEVRIWGINMAFGMEKVEIRLADPLVVTGPRRVSYPIPKEEKNLRSDE